MNNRNDYPSWKFCDILLFLCMSVLSGILLGCTQKEVRLSPLVLPGESPEQTQSLEETWKMAFQKTQSLLQKAKESLDQATKTLYALLWRGQENLFLLVDDPSLQRKLILVAYKKRFFSRTLPEGQSKDLNQCWEKLAEAQENYLHAQRIIAEMRGAWPIWYQFPDRVAESPFPEIGDLVQNLPTLARMDEQQEEMEVLLAICRELLKKNVLLVPVQLRPR